MNLDRTCAAMVSEADRLERQGLIPEAIAAYERLLAEWPGLPNCWYNLARLQRHMGEFSAALASYREALERGVTQPEQVHLNRGVIFSDCLRQYAEAERELDKALALNPSYIPALINLANLHEDLGRRDLAAAVYERLLEIAPEEAQVLARYAGLKVFSSLDDPLIARMRGVLAKPDTSAGDRANIEFALGRALDGCQAYDAAFETYRAANRHSRESAGPSFRDYDLKSAEQFIDRLIAAFPAVSGAGGPLTIAQKTSRPQPIFVCGMFRSGSTLAEQLLGSHPQVMAGGELDFLPRSVETRLAPFPESIPSASPQRMQALAVEYLNLLHGLFPEAPFVTDKRPDNFLYIGLIKMLFPNAKIVHTVRDAMDNCLSLYFLHLDQSMAYALDLMDIGHHYLQYLRLMAHWKALFGADIFDLHYDALVRAPEPEIARLLAFLGLEWDPRCLSVPPTGRGIRTASVWQVREPLYQSSSGRAHHYERQLRTLREYMERMRPNVA
jgi:tetratricopeptide (TPR) repeat protein